MSKRLAAMILLVATGCSGSLPAASPGPGATSSRGDFPRRPWSAATGEIKASPVGLTQFEDCAKVGRFFRNEALSRVGPHGIEGLWGNGHYFGDVAFATTRSGVAESAPAPMAASGGSAKDQSSSYSRTNVQEAGVDEPDLIKTDGSRILAIARGRLHYVAVDGGRATLRGSLALPGYAGEMLVHGDRALVFANAWGGRVDALGKAWENKERTQIFVVEIGDPKRMRVVSTLHVEGSYVSARMIDGVARVVLRSSPTDLPIVYPQGPGAAETTKAIVANKRVVRTASLDAWVPNFVLDDRRGPKRRVTEGRVSSCDRVHRTKTFTGFASTSVMTIDPAHPSPKGAATVVGDAQVVYANTERLYVAVNRWEDRGVGGPASSSVPARPPVVQTQIHSFDITDPAQARYRASGTVKGHVLNQFSMSEHEGVLRVATTQHAFDGTDKSESFVFTLGDAPKALVPLGSVGNLGKGERIYAVRFIGTLGYVVTFRQVDPLYVVDLADPRKPVVRGELKIPGYSAYLHPVGDGLLVGVGASATNEGQRTGMQISLFDVRNPADPKQLHVRTIDNAYTEAEHQHHAFLWWPASKLLVLPIHGQVGAEQWGSWAQGFTIDEARGIDSAGRIEHPSSAAHGGFGVTRTIVIGERLFSLSDLGLMASDLEGLDRTGWLEWPAPPQDGSQAEPAPAPGR